MRYRPFIAILSLSFCAIQLQTKAAQPPVLLQPGGDQSAARQPLPVPVTYEFLFRRIALLKSLADERDSRGQNSKSLRDKVGQDFLLDRQAADLLEAVALDCLQTVQGLDEQAQHISSQARALYLATRRTRQSPPVCPKELYDLQSQRDNAFLDARARLQAAFGDALFAQFENRVTQIVSKTTEVRPVR